MTTPTCTCNLPNGQINPAFDCVLHEVIPSEKQKDIPFEKSFESYCGCESCGASGRYGFYPVSIFEYVPGIIYRRLRPTAQAREGGEDTPEHMVETEVFGAYRIYNTACKLMGESASELDAGYKRAAIKCAQTHLSIVSNLERERDELKQSNKELVEIAAQLYLKRDELQQSLAASQAELKNHDAGMELTGRRYKSIKDMMIGEHVPEVVQALANTLIEKESLKKELQAAQAQVAELANVLNSAYNNIARHDGCSHYQIADSCILHEIEKVKSITPSKALPPSFI